MGFRPNKELREDAIALRREKVLELTAKGYSQRQIESMLNISHGTVNNDQTFLRQQAKINIQRHIDERLPEEYEKCLVGINAINKEAWTISQNAEDNREKISALALAKECYSMKLDLLTNAELVSNAAKFVEKHKQSDKDDDDDDDNNNNNNKSPNTTVHPYIDKDNNDSSDTSAALTQTSTEIGNDKESPTTNEVF